jgi:hypothetical protein
MLGIVIESVAEAETLARELRGFTDDLTIVRFSPPEARL